MSQSCSRTGFPSTTTITERIKKFVQFVLHMLISSLWIHLQALKRKISPRNHLNLNFQSCVKLVRNAPKSDRVETRFTGEVVKRCRNIFCRVSVGGVADDEAGLAHGSVSNQDAVHLALRCGAGPPALHAQREVPVRQDPRRGCWTVYSAHRFRHTARLLLHDLLRQHGSAFWQGAGFCLEAPRALHLLTAHVFFLLF